ncbi:MAG: T9SS type A sorting domain-containing protein [Ignavibacteria bacterium]|nr:T9SS type A sorting domain-containing protein [Ignavibacteria bacterium]
MRKLKNILLLSSILIITVAFDFKDNPPSGWYQQFLPNINGRQIADMTFIDSITGYIVTTRLASPDTSYILKTTDGGDNWNIVLRGPTNTIGGFNNIQFINSQTGFACGNFLWKTTNAGINWFNINTSGAFPEHMHVLNQDTIWIIDSESLTGGVYRTTNGGTNWVRQLSLGSQNPTNIYFYNKDIGYTASSVMYKTTNGGVNWFNTNQTGFADMQFINETTGWKCYGPMQKTTNGGLSWVTQTLPSGNYISLAQISSFSVLNKDTIWGCNGNVTYPNGQSRGMIYTTTNGGNNWLYQVPDTSINIYRYYHIQFINKSCGWAYAVNKGIHTKVGGDPLTLINYTASQIPKQYYLYQNYPNPFNPGTSIAYQISTAGDVNIKVYDIGGKEITTLVNQKKNAGSYEVRFYAFNLSSGIYFYALSVDGTTVQTKKMMLVK